MSWRERHHEKLITPQQAAAMIQSGQRVLVALGTVEPQYIAAALIEIAHPQFRIELRAAARARFGSV